MEHKAPFQATTGPRSAKIAFVGEAFGKDEEQAGLPFFGSSGQELDRMLVEAGLNRREVFCTNVFSLRPVDNKIEFLCSKKAFVTNSLPALKQGHYLRDEYLPEIARLKVELETLSPNLIVALGNTACWALLGTSGISSLRGVVSNGTLVPGVKVMPTYHPAAVLRKWDWRVIVLADLMKAKVESLFPDIRRPEREVLIQPSLAEIVEWFKRPATMYAVDIETKNKQITCIGFARSRSDAISIPFVDETKSGNSFWPDIYAELAAWRQVRKALAGPQAKLFQNGLYDLQYLARMGFKVMNCLHDTMLLHHSLYPELPKGLGFLGSIYSNEAAWKIMRNRKEEVLKKDD